MLAGVVNRFGQVHAQDVPMPKIGEYDALVKILACAFCNGTDSHIIEGTFPFLSPLPVILGHESVGKIVEIGRKVRKYKVGDLVFRPMAAYKDVPNAPNISWGGFAEYGIVSDGRAIIEDKAGQPLAGSWSMQQIIPENIDPVEATTLITVKENLSSLLIGKFSAGKSLLIFGSGPVGMSFAFCGRMLGASLIVLVGRRAERLRQTMDFGVDMVIDSSKEDVVRRARELSKGKGFDLVIEAIGNYELVNLAVKTVAQNGTVGLYGVPPVSREKYQQFPLDFRGTPGNWSLSILNPDEPSTHEIVCGWAIHGLVPMKRFVTHILPLQEIQRAYEIIKGRNAIKVVIANQE
ncbi:zinc-binding dehydrogenase [Candidatus Poribacteria bacterium]|nr:zinc-binding dehydrogenase [Candidatus Poribacteria bacterium]